MYNVPVRKHRTVRIHMEQCIVMLETCACDPRLLCLACSRRCRAGESCDITIKAQALPVCTSAVFVTYTTIYIVTSQRWQRATYAANCTLPTRRRATAICSQLPPYYLHLTNILNANLCEIVL